MLSRATRRALRGAGALGMVVLQLVAAAALPSADAVLDAERAALPLHVESPQSEDCPSGHDHLFCQVVRSLAAASAGGSAGSLLHRAPLHTEEFTRVGRIDAELHPSPKGPTAPRPPPLG